MKKTIFIGLGLLLSVAIITGISYLVYSNIFYLDGKNIGLNRVFLENYKELPRLIELWPGTRKLTADRRSLFKEFGYVDGNKPVKKIEVEGSKTVVSLYFAEPDMEDDIVKRSAVVNYYFFSPTNLTDTVLLAIIRTEDSLVGQSYQRSRIQLELTDQNGKTMVGIKPHLSLGGKNTFLVLRPTLNEPIPMGSARNGFDIKNIARITVRFILGRYPDGISKFPAHGKLFIDKIYLTTNLDPIVNFIGRPNQDRVTRDNFNFSYKWRRTRWEKEKREFFVGVNYPWHNYGWDFGQNPYGEPANSGWSVREQKLRDDFEYLKSAGVSVVRIYIFFDLRTGLKYVDGELIGLDEYVNKDLETLFRVAGQTGMKIIPVLFDFGIADGIGTPSGEHPELIFSHNKYEFLVNTMPPVLRNMDKWNSQYGEPVFAIELMNEPENMAALMIPGYFGSLKNWFKDLTNIIHNETSFKVTLGSHSIVDMQRWWDGLDIDMWQFHFYKYMLYEHDQWPQVLKRSEVSIPGLMFCGEMQPFEIAKNIEVLKNNGYDGILFWAWNTNDGFGLRENPEFDEITKWVEKNLSKN